VFSIAKLTRQADTEGESTRIRLYFNVKAAQFDAPSMPFAYAQLHPLCASAFPLYHFPVEALYAKLSRIGMVSADMSKLSTTEKIKRLGNLRKQICQPYRPETLEAYVSWTPEECEELLTFAILICHQGITCGISGGNDKAHQDMIYMIRCHLENEVHTAAGH
jgi:hypothetical protein